VTLIREAVKALARKCGLHVYRLAYAPFGVDVWHDIMRLSQSWDRHVARIFDVGANIGQTAKQLRVRFPNAAIYCFEPHPDTFKKLAFNTKREGILRFNKALSNRVGEAELFSYDSDVLNSLTPTAPYAVRFGQPVRKKILVQTTTIDDFCVTHKIPGIDILKVDAEGADLQVLQGADKTLSTKSIGFVYVEFNTILVDTERTGGALAPVCDLLKSHGYEFVCSYTDYIVPEGKLFGVHNALFYPR
jgi:FkbM family methyltransferase